MSKQTVKLNSKKGMMNKQTSNENGDKTNSNIKQQHQTAKLEW